MWVVVNADQGLVILSGCGHSGIINTLEYARSSVRNAPIHAAVGGFHLYQLDDAKLEWTAGKLREFGLGNLLGAHCTGKQAGDGFGEMAGLDPGTRAVDAESAV